MHSSASSLSTLADESVDVVALTYQSFRTLSATRTQSLDEFLRRPTYVVVDEAHHAASPTYAALLDHIEGHRTVLGVIGLTATPFPTAAGARRAFDARFPEPITEVDPLSLIANGVLARPVITTVDTDFTPTMTAQEITTAVRSDLPQAVLGQLDTDRRNRLVVETWLARAAHWGKTLLFATRIDHANKLTEMLVSAGVEARSLHSRTRDRNGTLTWFDQAREPVVLVSVGMLTEGVDLPDAQTAMIARATTSPILMRQMVGRVLRGPLAGGSAEASVVHFRDDWRLLPDVLEPAQVLMCSDREGTRRRGWAPGPIVDDDALAVRDDVAAQIARAYEQVGDLFDTGDDDPYNDLPLPPLNAEVRISGFYDVNGLAIRQSPAGWWEIECDARCVQLASAG